MKPTVVLIETLGEFRQRRECFLVGESGLQIEVHGSGIFRVLEPEVFCSLCQGHRGVKFFFDQNDVQTCDCPVCNGGDRKRWDELHARWARVAV